jgi:hypothetical protein
MRELTFEEKEAWYGRALWPCCGKSGYLAGPRGGMCMNIKCPRCGTKMNVIDPELREYWSLTEMPGQMIEEPAGYNGRPLSLWQKVKRAWLAR